MLVNTSNELLPPWLKTSLLTAIPIYSLPGIGASIPLASSGHTLTACFTAATGAAALAYTAHRIGRLCTFRTPKTAEDADRETFRFEDTMRRAAESSERTRQTLGYSAEEWEKKQNESKIKGEEEFEARYAARKQGKLPAPQ